MAPAAPQVPFPMHIHQSHALQETTGADHTVHTALETTHSHWTDGQAFRDPRALAPPPANTVDRAPSAQHTQLICPRDGLSASRAPPAELSTSIHHLFIWVPSKTSLKANIWQQKVGLGSDSVMTWREWGSKTARGGDPTVAGGGWWGGPRGVTAPGSWGWGLQGPLGDHGQRAPECPPYPHPPLEVRKL